MTGRPPGGRRLSRAALNRTLLRRQFLDAPADVTTKAAAEHLAG